MCDSAVRTLPPAAGLAGTCEEGAALAPLEGRTGACAEVTEIANRTEKTMKANRRMIAIEGTRAASL